MTKGRHTTSARDASPFAHVGWPPGEDLVAWGGTLDPDLVLDAYRHGLFPMGEASAGDAGENTAVAARGSEGPVLWWSPDPRGVLPLDGLHVSRRLLRTIQGRTLKRPARKDRPFSLRFDTSFEAVMRACGERRADGSWITEPMVACYVELHRRGHAHSVEVWEGNELVGGTYGLAFGGVFAAESKFHRVRDASKVALCALVERLRDRGYSLLDVQWRTDHLAQFGVVEIPRTEYLARLRAARDRAVSFT